MDSRTRQRLQDMVDMADEMAENLRGKTRQDFLEGKRLQRIAERLLEIAGEAATHIPDEMATEIGGNWRGLRRLRIVLAHGYMHVDPNMLWNEATRDLPVLVDRVRAALR